MKSIAAIAMLALLLVLAGGGHVLSRIDRIQAEQRATTAQVRMLAARVELALVVAQRDVKPAIDPRVDTCVRRTDALRAAIFALVRTGNASMVGDPSWGWAAWR